MASANLYEDISLKTDKDKTETNDNTDWVGKDAIERISSTSYTTVLADSLPSFHFKSAFIGSSAYGKIYDTQIVYLSHVS